MLGVFLALAVLPALAPGKTVTLAPGTYDLVVIRGQTFAPPVTIEAGSATVRGIRIWDSKGIVWRGGVVTAPGGTMAPDGSPGRGPFYYGADVRRSDGVTFDGTRFTDAVRGAAIANSRNIIVRNCEFTGLRSDGINLPGSSLALVENNRFNKFSPIKPTGSKAEGNWKDGDHPDAIQMWTTKSNPRMTDITIRGNTIEGDTQGINTFGPHGEGYARITVENNDVRILYPAAISVLQCDGCSVRGNQIASLPGARFTTNVRFDRSTGVSCGNTMAAAPSHKATARCK